MAAKTYYIVLHKRVVEARVKERRRQGLLHVLLMEPLEKLDSAEEQLFRVYYCQTFVKDLNTGNVFDSKRKAWLKLYSRAQRHHLATQSQADEYQTIARRAYREYRKTWS